MLTAAFRAFGGEELVRDFLNSLPFWYKTQEVLFVHAGIKPGVVHGATDEYGYFAVENKVTIHDLHATILQLMGFDHERFTYRYAGRDFRLTDVHGEIVHDRISVEIMRGCPWQCRFCQSTVIKPALGTAMP